jgi:hypothetical protein
VVWWIRDCPQLRTHYSELTAPADHRPDEDTPTAVLVRQVLGAIAQFGKATMVAKLKAAFVSRASTPPRRPERHYSA